MSQVNTKTVLLGSNADQSKNFKITVPTPEDGTLTIERANGTDVMKFLANGGVDMPTLPFLKAATGYVTLPNGFLVQWGVVVASTTSGSTNFPREFPQECVGVMITDAGGVGDVLKAALNATSFVFNKTLFNWYGINPQTGAAASPGTFFYFAIGY